MEKAKRRSFTEDYKRQTVELVHSSGRSVGSIAAEIGLAETVLRNWMKKFRAVSELAAAPRRSTTQAALPTADQASEIARLRRENERLKMERDILKKSIAIFAGTRT